MVDYTPPQVMINDNGLHNINHDSDIGEYAPPHTHREEEPEHIVEHTTYSTKNMKNYVCKCRRSHTLKPYVRKTFKRRRKGER